ncbi:MAG: aminotransferase class V-fold PLP-dependent enzyme [Phycisphaerales bacterium]|nr:aminotransferase class V-fold PLP-dependent enzyme [Phycisphaerales bacterium]
MATCRRVYLDNAATSFPKPAAVASAMADFTRTLGASPGRGAYEASLEAGEALSQVRAAVGRLLGERDGDRVIFTLNCTDALTLAICGIAKHWRRRGQPIHMVTTAMDHNSVLRPLNDLREDGVEITILPADPVTGLVDPDDLSAAIRRDTRLAALVHGSNVSGTVQDIAALSDRCRSRGVPVLVDAAQTAGHHPLAPGDMGIDLLAIPGHKGLLGPLGTGALWLGPNMETIVDPIRLGGTGSRSEEATQPLELPDRYESGSHNTVGLIGLGAAAEWIETTGVKALHERHQRLGGRMLEGLLSIDALRVVGPQSMETRCGVFSIVSPNLTHTQLARQLEQRHGVEGRAGLHCAPLAHQTLGTLDAGGTLRLSIGAHTTMEEVDLAVDAVRCVHDSASRVIASVGTT